MRYKDTTDFAYRRFSRMLVACQDNVQIDESVLFAGEGVVVKSHARLEAGSIIGSNVTIGSGAIIRPGAVVLSSVPANAIIEGNPARVCGYTTKLNAPNVNIPVLSDTEKEGKSAFKRVSLGVSGCEIFSFPEFSDFRGSLIVGALSANFPFVPKRFFFVFDVPSQELRGEHAHKKCEQFLVCIHGSCRVLLDDGNERCEVLLNKPNLGVYMPPGIWGTQYDYSADAVLFVFASEEYDDRDYIRTYDDFLQSR